MVCIVLYAVCNVLLDSCLKCSVFSVPYGVCRVSYVVSSVLYIVCSVPCAACCLVHVVCRKNCPVLCGVFFELYAGSGVSVCDSQSLFVFALQSID